MSDAERDYYQRKYESLCEKESELASKIAECQALSAKNQGILDELKREKARLMSILSSKQVNVNDIDIAAAHIERLWMQLEDHLSMESQFVRGLQVQKQESNGWSLLEKGISAGVAVAAIVVGASVAKFRWGWVNR